MPEAFAPCRTELAEKLQELQDLAAAKRALEGKLEAAAEARGKLEADLSAKQQELEECVTAKEASQASRAH